MKIAVTQLNYPLENYVAALTSLGAEPVPVRELVPADGFDGLLLPGGTDVNPERYGEANRASRGISDAFDEFQFSQLDAFVKAGKPVLGICRGLQVVNVYFGGTLIQHLPSAERHARKTLQDADKMHSNRALPGMLLEKLYGPVFSSNSSHHQAAAKIGKGLKVTAFSDDGVVEALSHETLPILCTQFHPERMCLAYADGRFADGSKIFREFLEMGRKG